MCVSSSKARPAPAHGVCCRNHPRKTPPWKFAVRSPAGEKFCSPAGDLLGSRGCRNPDLGICAVGETSQCLVMRGQKGRLPPPPPGVICWMGQPRSRRCPIYRVIRFHGLTWARAPLAGFDHLRVLVWRVNTAKIGPPVRKRGSPGNRRGICAWGYRAGIRRCKPGGQRDR